jgi:tetratricopeptide (TPR) repeat protein
VGEYYGLIADHLEAAGRSRQAIDYLRRAGDRAAIQFANAEAVAFFSRALDLTPGDDLTERHSLLLAREQIHDLLGDREAQARDLAELQRLANALHDKGRQAESALRQARYALATSNHPGAITAAQAAIQLAREAGDPRAEVAGHLHWGQALSEQSDFEAARRLLEKTVTLAQAGRLRPEQAQGLRHLGSVYWCLGEYPQAGIHYTESLALTRDIGDRRNEASALNNLGLVHWRQGEYAQASDYLERALQIRCQIGDRLGEASTLSNLTGLSLESGDLSQAQRYCEGALAITRQTGNRNREGLALLHLGDIQAALGAYADARACCEQALEILHGVGNQRLEGAALDNLANVCRCQGDYSPAIAYLEQALLITRAMGDRQSGAACLHDLGWVLHCLGDYRAARENYDEALQINREIGDRGREAEVLASLGLLSHHQGDHETARVYCQSASAIHQQVGRREMEGHALTNLGHALHSLGCMKEAAAAYRQALALRRDQGQPHLATEPLAGLARIALTQGNLAQARVHVQGILDHLQANTLEGTDEPFRVYLTCYRVLHGSQDPRAETILTTAHGLLLAQAAKIGDRGLQRSFLENVVTHRELLEAWQEHR